MTDSDAFRRFTKQGPGRAVIRSRAFRRADLERNRIRTAYAARQNRDQFRSVATFCLFIGHNKSGTSMLGGLLDAHPRVVLSDEVDALRYVDAGFGRDQLFHLLLKGARVELRKGRVTARRLQPYSYLVPGQWQGRTERPLVVGDSTSGSSTRRLGEQPELLDRIREMDPHLNVKLIHVIRNPFDPISVMMVRGRRTFENAIDHYFAACNALVRIRTYLAFADVLPVWHECFVADPQSELASVCAFLGLEADLTYLNACAGIIRRQPDRSREMVDWTPPWIERVEREMSRFDFLSGYSYAN